MYCVFVWDQYGALDTPEASVLLCVLWDGEGFKEAAELL